MKKSPKQEILELKAQLKLAEKKINRLEKEVDQKDKKALFFDLMIDIQI